MKKRILFLLSMLVILGAGLFVISSFYLPTPAPVSTETLLTVTFLDVGQGDAALLGYGDHWMLIDGGGRDSSQKIYTVLKERAITHLELIIASHPHEDHVGGLSAAFQIAQVDSVLCPTDNYDSKAFENLKRYAQEKSTGITIPSNGDTFSLGNAKVEILGLNAGASENARSMVTKVTLGNTSFLFPGDMEPESIPLDWDLSAAVLKVSHHGSYSGTSLDFLKRVSPKHAVISLGKDNTYGMPHGSTLELLKQHCNTLYRTDLQGDITFRTDGNTVQVSTQKTASSRALFTPGDGSTTPSEVIAVTFDYRYVINTSSKAFHDPLCPSVDQMKEQNKRFSSDTREALILAGFKPCSNCKP